MGTIPNILCLGVSYPCLERTVTTRVRMVDGKHNDKNNNGIVGTQSRNTTEDTELPSASLTQEPIANLEDKNGRIEMQDGTRKVQSSPTTNSKLDLSESIGQVLEYVQNNFITAMDGRDLARCLATEQHCSVRVYTVSQESGAVYKPTRHLWANFNRPSFVHTLRKKFQQDIQFDQIILDYFWIPAGWDVSHWKSHFFQHTLVQLARQNVLKQPTKNNVSSKNKNKNNNQSKNSRHPRGLEKTGNVYLPFCFHCFKEVMAHKDVLVKCYDISFVRKENLDEVALWSGTQQIDADSMQGILGKQRNQEELYCSFGPCDVREALDDPRVAKRFLISIARQLEDFSTIRFIALTRLTEDESIGQIRGLTPIAQVQRGFDQTIATATTKMALSKTPALPITDIQVNAKPRATYTPRQTPRRPHVISTSPTQEEESPAFNTRLSWKRRIDRNNIAVVSESKCRKRLWSQDPTRAASETVTNAATEKIRVSRRTTRRKIF